MDAVAGVRAPVVELLVELEVEEALRREDAFEPADPARRLEQLAAVGADELDEDVELPGGDDDVAGLVPLRDRLGDRLGRAARTDADHRLRLEAEAERVGHARDLQDVVQAESVVTGANRGLGDAHAGGDAAERLATVLLESLDQRLVDGVEAAGHADRPAPQLLLNGSQCEAYLPVSRAYRQLRAVRNGSAKRVRAGAARSRSVQNDHGPGTVPGPWRKTHGRRRLSRSSPSRA